MSRLTAEERQNLRIAKGAIKSKGGLGQAMSEVLVKIIERLDREDQHPALKKVKGKAELKAMIDGEKELFDQLSEDEPDLN